MKFKVKENVRYKELAEYLKTKESEQDFLTCLASGKDWNSFLEEKGLLDFQEVEYDEPLDLTSLK